MIDIISRINSRPKRHTAHHLFWDCRLRAAVFNYICNDATYISFQQISTPCMEAFFLKFRKTSPAFDLFTVELKGKTFVFPRPLLSYSHFCLYVLQLLRMVISFFLKDCCFSALKLNYVVHSNLSSEQNLFLKN